VYLKFKQEYLSGVAFRVRAAILDGLAVDGVRQKLYYTDAATGGGRVAEISTDGSDHRVLIYDPNSYPRGVVIDELHR